VVPSGRIRSRRSQQHLTIIADAAQHVERAMQALDAYELDEEEDRGRSHRSQRDFLITEMEVKQRGRLERTAQIQNLGTRNAQGGVDAGGPGPGHYELKGMVGKLEVKLEIAQAEIARMNEALLNEVRVQRDKRTRPPPVLGAASALTTGDEFKGEAPSESILELRYHLAVGEISRLKRQETRTQEANRCLQDELAELRATLNAERRAASEELLNEVRAQRDAAHAKLDAASRYVLNGGLERALNYDIDDALKKMEAKALKRKRAYEAENQ